jgi:hypothetical protein
MQMLVATDFNKVFFVEVRARMFNFTFQASAIDPAGVLTCPIKDLGSLYVYLLYFDLITNSQCIKLMRLTYD